MKCCWAVIEMKTENQATRRSFVTMTKLSVSLLWCRWQHSCSGLGQDWKLPLLSLDYEPGIMLSYSIFTTTLGGRCYFLHPFYRCGKGLGEGLAMALTLHRRLSSRAHTTCTVLFCISRWWRPWRGGALELICPWTCWRECWTSEGGCQFLRTW